MHRIDGDGNVAGLFDPGDPLIPTPATQVTADWANAIQEELVNVIQTQGGVTLSKPNNTQLWAALVARFGRLGTANTWAGNQSVGGFLAVTASTTLTGPLVANGTATFNAGFTANATLQASGVVGATHAVVSGGTSDRMAGTNGNNYPIGEFRAFGPNNTLRLTARARNRATSTDWTTQQLGWTADVDTVLGALGSFYLGLTGASITSGTTSTGAAPTNALSLTNGNLSLDGVANPNSNVAVKNTLTPRNFVKVSATIKTTNSNGTIVVDDSFNVAAQPGGVALNGSLIRVTFAQAFASANYQVTFGINDSWGGVFSLYWRTKTAAYVDIAVSQVNGTAASFATLNTYFDISITGAQ